jgi:hypothetical protein
MMAGLEREQLDALRRQIEEDYRLDMAAIDRLQRRFMSSGGGISSINTGGISAISSPPATERNVTVLPSAVDPHVEAEPDELTSTLRGMFSSHRR